MKRLNKLFLLTLGLALLLPALPMTAVVPVHAQRRGGGGRGRVFVGVGGWGWGWWGWPGYYGPGYGYVYGQARQWAAIDTDISPEEARVYLDGRYIGTADDFDGNPDYLYLKRGHYRIEFRLDGFETVTKDIDARPGMYLDFKDKMRKVPGAARHGSYETPKLEGGIRRYFGKRGSSTEAITEDRGDYDRDDQGEYDRPDRDGDREPPVREGNRERSGQGWRGSRPPAPRGEESAEAQARGTVKTRLRLQVEPRDAAVYVDDRFVGTAEEINSLERGVSVAPGRHTVTVSRPGFRDKSVEVTVEAGRTEKLEVSLGR